MLAKLAGTQRIRGHVTLDDREGFAFDGELYCPTGSCTEQVRGRFKAMGQGGFKGTLDGTLDADAVDGPIAPAASLIVTMFPAPANAFGGSSYGGDGYGDPFGYDGGGSTGND